MNILIKTKKTWLDFKKLGKNWVFMNFWVSIQTQLKIIFEFWVFLLNSKLTSTQLDFKCFALAELVLTYNIGLCSKLRLTITD